MENQRQFIVPIKPPPVPRAPGQRGGAAKSDDATPGPMGRVSAPLVLVKQDPRGSAARVQPPERVRPHWRRLGIHWRRLGVRLQRKRRDEHERLVRGARPVRGIVDGTCLHHAASQLQHEKKLREILDVVIGQRAAVIELLVGNEQTLLNHRNPNQQLDPPLDEVDRVPRIRWQQERRVGQGFYTELHGNRRPAMASSSNNARYGQQQEQGQLGEHHTRWRSGVAIKLLEPKWLRIKSFQIINWIRNSSFQIINWIEIQNCAAKF